MSLMVLLLDTYNCGLRMCQECRERFPRHRLQRKPLVSDPGMHHGTCVTHVPRCMSGSLTQPAVVGKAFPAFPMHAQSAILRIWQEAHCMEIVLYGKWPHMRCVLFCLAAWHGGALALMHQPRQHKMSWSITMWHVALCHCFYVILNKTYSYHHIFAISVSQGFLFLESVLMECTLVACWRMQYLMCSCFCEIYFIILSSIVLTVYDTGKAIILLSKTRDE